MRRNMTSVHRHEKRIKRVFAVSSLEELRQPVYNVGTNCSKPRASVESIVKYVRQSERNNSRMSCHELVRMVNSGHGCCDADFPPDPRSVYVKNHALMLL